MEDIHQEHAPPPPPEESHEPAPKHIDPPMDTPMDPPVDAPMHVVDPDESNNSTITAATVAPLPEFQQSTSSYSNGYSSEARPQTSYSDTAYQYSGGHGGDGYHSRFNTPSDADTPPRHQYHNPAKDTQMAQSHSRPSSQLGRYSSSESNSRPYPDQNQRAAQQDPAKNPSVVIKVGMVGDAQIGKTSLMVKYVEGSWDEDYIQTLGESPLHRVRRPTADCPRRQLHGEDHLHQEHRDHLLHLGSWRPTRVRQHASPCLQRRRGHPLHVRPHPQEHPELDQGMVSPRTRL